MTDIKISEMKLYGFYSNKQYLEQEFYYEYTMENKQVLKVTCTSNVQNNKMEWSDLKYVGELTNWSTCITVITKIKEY